MARVIFSAGSPQSRGNIRIDYQPAVPEPSTIILLACGALAGRKGRGTVL